MKTTLLIELDYGDNVYDTADGECWFFNEILLGGGGQLFLHSNDIGDTIGAVNVLKVCEGSEYKG